MWDASIFLFSAPVKFTFPWDRESRNAVNSSEPSWIISFTGPLIRYNNNFISKGIISSHLTVSRDKKGCHLDLCKIPFLKRMEFQGSLSCFLLKISKQQDTFIREAELCKIIRLVSEHISWITFLFPPLIDKMCYLRHRRLCDFTY